MEQVNIDPVMVEIVIGAARMMQRDGITASVFQDNMEALTKAYVEAYVERQRKISIEFLTNDDCKARVTEVLMSMIKKG